MQKQREKIFRIFILQKHSDDVSHFEQQHSQFFSAQPAAAAV